MTMDDPHQPGVASQMGGAALGALMGLAIGGPLAAAIDGPVGAALAVAAGSVLTPAMEVWVAKCRQEFGRRGHEIAAGAAHASHLAADEAVERILTCDDIQPLVMRVLDSAIKTDSTPKLRALGMVLGEAAGNRSRQIDEDLMILKAIDLLEAAHLRILERMKDPVPNHPEGVWTLTLVSSTVSDLSEAGTQAAIGGLLAHGLIQNTGGGGYSPAGYAITTFGLAMLDAMRRIEPESNES
jgi:hypothetical protein